MSDKELKDKAIKIKGKDYVLVSDRVNYFNENFPLGAITAEYEIVGDTYIVKATVIPDTTKPERKFTGLSQATIGDGMVNKTAALENAETSAWGRALGAMGIGVIESIASADEMHKATGSNGSPSMKVLSPKSLAWIASTAERELGLDNYEDISKFLGFPVEKLPQSKVKAAVDKIETAARDQKENEQPFVIAVDDNEPITIDDIPY